jgi:hypothetical protein
VPSNRMHSQLTQAEAIGVSGAEGAAGQALVSGSSSVSETPLHVLTDRPLLTAARSDASFGRVTRSSRGDTL